MSSLNLLVWIIELVLVTTLVSLSCLFIYYQYCFTYWKRKGIPTLPASFPAGNLGQSAFGKESVFLRLQTLHNTFRKKNLKYGGVYFFNGPIFMPIDPELIKHILVSDFDHFVDRGMYLNKEKYPLTNHILSMQGEEWKNMRSKLTPAFTSGKLKAMFNIMMTNCQNLVQMLEPAANEHDVVDIKELLLRMTTDIIGSASFGIDYNTLKNPETEFACMVRNIFNPPFWKLWLLALEEGFQNPGNILKLSHSDRVLEEYFTELVRKTIEYRDQNNVVREDFLNILMQMRETIGMSLKEIVAESFLFFTAGFETSSSTISSCIHELAYNQDLQQEIRTEIQENLGTDSSKYSYDNINTLPALDKAIKGKLYFEEKKLVSDSKFQRL